MNSIKLIEGHWYKFEDRGEEHIGYYVGRQTGFECCVCGKGRNAYTFNIWHSFKNDYSDMDYETWGYGKEHLPVFIKDLGVRNGIVLDNRLIDYFFFEGE